MSCPVQLSAFVAKSNWIRRRQRRLAGNFSGRDRNEMEPPNHQYDSGGVLCNNMDLIHGQSGAKLRCRSNHNTVNESIERKLDATRTKWIKMRCVRRSKERANRCLSIMLTLVTLASGWPQLSTLGIEITDMQAISSISSPPTSTPSPIAHTLVDARILTSDLRSPNSTSAQATDTSQVGSANKATVDAVSFNAITHPFERPQQQQQQHLVTQPTLESTAMSSPPTRSSNAPAEEMVTAASKKKKKKMKMMKKKKKMEKKHKEWKKGKKHKKKKYESKKKKGGSSKKKKGG